MAEQWPVVSPAAKASTPFPACLPSQLERAGTSGILAEQIWALPFRERVDVCESIFCAAPTRGALMDDAGEICAKPGFECSALSLE